MKVAIGSDHRGYAAKEKIKSMLASKGYEVMDMGTDSPASCDYPDIAYPTCKMVTSGNADLGILLCGTGIGMSISANKVHGIRAACCHDELTAEMARRHNNANVLCLPADLIGEELMRRIVDVYLNTGFEGGRHERRLRRIAEYEMKEGQNAGEAMKQGSPAALSEHSKATRKM
ncbi:MAG: ribose 5-phosphate isomerase B [Phycisphaerae bacterium]